MWKRGSFAFACGLITLACGATSAPSPRTARAGSADPAGILLAIGAECCAVLRRPERSIEDLDAARREAQGPERRALTRDLIVAYAFAAEDADGREARRMRRRAEQLADAAVRGARDPDYLAEIAFAQLWLSWRAGSRNAEQRATRFTERHRSSGDLLALAWMIRGEIALSDERFEDAVTAFRFGLGQLGHPLYAYALWRTAAAYRRLGRAEDAAQALAEVEQLGCPASASPFVVRIATAAAGERASGLRRDPDGVTRPASCPPPESREAEDEGWRPAE